LNKNRSNKGKGPKQDSQSRLRLSMPEKGDPSFE